MVKTTDINAPVEVFSGSFWEAGIVKSLLENADIMVFLKDDILGLNMPWVTAGGGSGAVKVVVSGVDFEKAVEIVNGYLAVCP